MTTNKNIPSSTPNAPASPRPRGLVTRRPSPMALEQRFMFDGAALLDAAATVSDAPDTVVKDTAPAPAPDTTTTTTVAPEPVSTVATTTETTTTDTSTAQGTTTDTATGATTATAPGDTTTTTTTSTDPAPTASTTTTANTTETSATASTSLASEAPLTEPVTAETTTGSHPVSASLNFIPVTTTAPPAILTQAIAQTDTTLASFALQGDASQQLFTLFNGGQASPSDDWTLQATELLDHLHSGGAPVTVALLDHQSMGGLIGAYAAPTADTAGVIYLNADWLATQTDAATVSRVLLEEMGHAIDHELNGDQDTAGDEGERFALTLGGLTLTRDQADRIAAENDTATLTIDGRSVSVEAASITFTAVYQGTPSALSEEAQSLNNITPLVGSNFQFVSSNPSDIYFSGNNVTGTLHYTDGNGDAQSIYGVASRLFKTGSTVDGIYFYAPGADGLIGTGDAGETAYLLQVNAVFTSGTNESTSSDPVDTALNNLLVGYVAPTAYADTSDSPGAQSAIETGLVEAGRNATGNVLGNDTGNASLSIQSITGSAGSQSVTGGTTGANVSGGTAVTGAHGTLYIAADGSYRYQVNNSDTDVNALRQTSDTLTDTFTYRLTDTDGATATATLTVRIEGSNDAPTAANDTDTAKESLLTDGTQYTATDPLGRTAQGNVLDNDTDPDRHNETAEIDGLYAAGTYVSHFLGGSTTNLTFSPTASTLQNVGTSHYVYIQTGSNYTLLTAGSTPIMVTGNTKLPDGSYSVTLSGTPTNYTLTSSTHVAFASSGNTNVTSGGNTREATVNAATAVVTSTVTVTQTSGTIQAGMSISGIGIPDGTRVTAVTSDGSGHLVLQLNQQLTAAPSGSFTLSAAAGTTLTGQYGTLLLNADGSYVYTPFANNANLAAGATATDSFRYTMRDDLGASSAATLTITVTGSAATDPNAVDDSGSATEAGGAANTGGSNATGTVLTNDTTPSGTNSVTAGRADSAATETTITAGNYTDLTGHYGTLRLWSNGNYVYTPTNGNAEVDALNVGDTLQDSFQYRIRNTASPAGEDVATLTITINGANDNPHATNDSIGATEDTAIQLTETQLLANDTDVDNTSLDILSVSNAIGGLVVLNSNGTLSFTPNANFTGNASFTYTMTDGTATSTAQVTLAIAAVNDAPTAADNTYGTDRNTPLTGVNVISDTDLTHGTDSDLEGDSLTVSKVNGQMFNANSSSVDYPATSGWMEVTLTHGTVYMQADGALAYVPNADDIVGDSFSYVVTDGADESVPAVVLLNVTDPGNTPAVVAGDDAGNVTEDASSPTLSDSGVLTLSDADGAAQEVFLTDASDITTSPATLGSLSLTSDGHWTYTVDNSLVQYLAANETLDEVFTVRTADGTQHEITVTIHGINDTPATGNVNDPTWDAIDGRYEVSTPEDTPKTGTIAASDLDADTLAFTEQTGPTKGTLTIDSSTGAWIYTPDTNYVGSDSFVVTVSDGNGGSVDVTVLVTVTPVNDPPVPGDVNNPTWDATDGRYEVTTPEDTPKIGTIAASDLDADTLSFTEQTGPTNGSLTIDSSTGAWTYTPDTNYVGSDSFIVTVSDGNGGSVDVTVLVTVTPVNDPPVPGDVNDPTWDATDGRYEVTTPEDTPKTGTIAASDLDADTLAFTEQTGPSNGTLSIDSSTGAWTYTPDTNYVGNDSFVVTVSDGNGGSVDVTVLVEVTPVNDPPVPGDVNDPNWDATNGRYEVTTPEDTPKTGTIAASDLDADTLAFTEQTGPTNGTLSIDSSTGAWTYTPDTNYVGSDSFVVTVSDGNGGSVDVTVLVEVTPINDPPVPGDVNDPTWDAIDGRYEVTTPEDTPKTGIIAASDLDADTLSFTEQTGPANGSLTIDSSTGAWTYTPDTNYVGNDSFIVTVSDGNGGSVDVTVLVEVTPINDPPVPGDVNDPTWDATDGRYEVSTPEDTPKTGTIAASDLDADTLAFTEQTGPTNGTLTIDSSTGAWTYTPDTNYVGNDSFIVTVSDGNGGSVDVTVLVEVTPVNDPPVPGDVNDPTWDAIDGRYEVSTPEDTPKTGTIAASDLDADTLAFTEQTGPTNGTLTIDSSTGAWIYTPDTNYVGSDSFIVTVSDGNGGSVDVTVLVTVTPVNDPPVPGDVNDPTWDATDGRYEVSTPEDTPKTGTIAASDLDADTLAFTEQTGPSNGTLSIDSSTGAWIYTPNTNYVGSDSFIVTVSDGNGGSVDVTVLVTVTPINDPPVPGDVNDPTWDASAGRYEVTTPEDTPKTGTIAGSDRDHDTLSFTRQTEPTHGTLSLDSTTGAWIYTPNANYAGNDSFIVTVADGHGGTVDVTVLVTVTPVPKPEPPAPAPPAPAPAPAPSEPPAPPPAEPTAPAPVPAPAPPSPAPEEPPAETSPQRFDSALPGNGPTPHAQLDLDTLPWFQPHWDTPLSDVRTQASGFQIPVDPAGTAGLSLNREVTDQFAQTGSATRISLPYDTFVHSDAQATVTLAALQSNGKPLPVWIAFDARTGSFTVSPPPGHEEEVEIQVTARDDRGNAITTKFKLHVGKSAIPAGRASLSEQLRREARGDMAWTQRVGGHDTAALPHRLAAALAKVNS